MKLNNDKFHIEEDNLSRTCYHGYQSFDPRERNLTPEKVHRIGVELVKRLYPDFQVVVATHVDRGHLHNHFVINAVNMKGRKLEDRLANPKEGLYGLRDESDKIALEHGLNIIEDAPKIGKFHKNKYLYNIATKTWRKQIIEMIENLKETCFTFDELLEELSLEGYQIKTGKNIRVKPYGKERFVTLKVLGEKYSEEELKKFFFNKSKNIIDINFEDYKINNPNSELLKVQKELIELSKKSLLLTMQDLNPNKKYPKYYNSRYLEIKRYHSLVDTINFLNEYKIYSYDDLKTKLDSITKEIEEKELAYKEKLDENETLQLRIPLCDLYLKYLDYYESYKEQQELSTEVVEKSEEVINFLKIKEELQVTSTDEVKEIIANANRIKIETNRQYAYLSYLKNKASSLEKIRAISLEKLDGYIKSVSVSKKMIDESRSTDKEYCIRIPYSNYYMYVPKSMIAWVSFDNRGILFLIDDKEYTLYNKYNEEVMKVSGEDVESVSKNEKNKISEYYKNKN